MVMASNSFGNIFKITTFGESHGKAIGLVIDGCPAGLELSVEEIDAELKRRAPGRSPFTSPRKEDDLCELISGTFEGKTTGCPICLLIKNSGQDPRAYESVKDLLKPGHANYTYLQKYGIFDYMGGGRASARETACRVAAGAIAKKILRHFDIHVAAYVKQIGPIAASINTTTDIAHLREATYNDPIYCPDQEASKAMRAILDEIKREGDSLGGLVECIAVGVPPGLGDPVYEKLEARLASAMMSIPAAKGFEIGSGFQAVTMKGSEHNDPFIGPRQTKTNHAGGVLGGISTGEQIVTRVAFKPTSSIKIAQETVNLAGEKKSFLLPEGAKHDPCVTIRAVPVVEAMMALVLVDLMLMNRCARL